VQDEDAFAESDPNQEPDHEQFARPVADCESDAVAIAN
jgi:hypothetical protein